MSELYPSPSAENHTGHTYSVDETDKPSSRTQWLDNFQRWCINHTGISMCFGFLLIGIGVYISDHEAEDLFLMVVSHFSIIAGEAIVVMFFLHFFVEKLNTEGHENDIKKLVDELSSQMHTEVNSLMSDFRREADITTTKLKENFFAAILHDKMPHKFVEQVLKNDFFNTSVLRENLNVKYDIQEDGSDLVIFNELEFTMTYVSGKERDLAYDMPFSLSDTPQLSYRLDKVNYQRVGTDIEPIYLDEAMHFRKVELGDSKEKDQFLLKEPIILRKDEALRVQQRFIARYNNFSGLVQDIYYVNQHTLDITITFKVTKGFSINVYPTFPEKMLPKVEKNSWKDEDVYPNIPFLVPGQGYMFTIKKEVAK